MPSLQRSACPRPVSAQLLTAVALVGLSVIPPGLHAGDAGNDDPAVTSALFRDITHSAGIRATHVNGASPEKYFAEIMGHLGATLIPRARVNSPKVASEDLPQYLRRVNREHEEIYEAIARRDAEAARAAMRLHLTNSRERLRRAQEAVQGANPAAA